MAVFLNSFIPLVINKQGIKASKYYKIPPFVDGSCRREPDFQNPFPAITQLCRPGKLVTRLNVGDLVIYITKLASYGNPPAHWKFIGVLEVIDFAKNHNQAEAYYIKNQLPVSQNVICNQTTPFPFHMTHGISGFPTKNLSPQNVIKKWNNYYIYRAKNYPKVAITRAWKDTLNLNNSPIITNAIMNNIFGRIPGTQNPPKISYSEWANFRNILKI